VLETKHGLDLEHARATSKALEAITIDAGSGISENTILTHLQRAREALN
jgi:hypothetical protein